MIKRVLVFAIALFIAGVASLPAAQAQMVTLRGHVTMKDGGPIEGAEVIARPTKKAAGVRKAKTDKDGKYSMYLEFGPYKITANKPGLIMYTLSVLVMHGTTEEQKTAGEIGPKQEMMEFTLQPSRTASFDFVMAPENYYAGVLTGPEAEALNSKIMEANKLTQDSQYAASNALVDEVLTKVPTATGPLYLKGLNEAGLGHRAAAEEFLQKAMAADPKLPGVRAALGDVAYRAGDKAKAVEWFDKELEINPANLPALMNKAVALEELGRKQDALAAYGVVIEKEPSTAAAYTSMASLYTELGQEEKAIEILQRMESVAKPDAKAWFNIGANFSNADKLDRAEQAYEKALELDPTLAEANREMGYIELRKGDSAKAAAYLEKYLAMKPNAEDADAMKKLLEQSKATASKPAAAEPAKPARKGTHK